VKCIFKLKFIVVLIFCNAIAVQAQHLSQTILFDFNNYQVPDTSARFIIKNLYVTLPDSIIIFGHCDSVGSDRYNKKLSQQRAQAVKNILLASGINNNIIKVCFGKGERQPIENNSTAINRQSNRRVEILFKVNNASKKVSLKAEIPKQIATNKPILKPKIDTLLKDRSLIIGQTIVLPSLKFIPGFHTLLPQSQNTLIELFELLQAKPQLKILICGHVCCTYPGLYDGTDLEFGTANLSVTRAKAIYQQLIEMGIDKKRLAYKGFGGSRKISVIEDNEQQKSLNRRVEIVVLGQ
jgi:outer membrane protein OmpA-like peptidoglycan-associated protein